MRVAILDDYQDAVRRLDCFQLLDGHDVTVFNQTLDGDALADALAGFDALVLIRERTHIAAALLARLPALKVISQTGKAGRHIDLAAAAARGITVLEGEGDPTAPAELTWALVMAAYRRVPQYVAQLQTGVWQSSTTQPGHERIGRTLHGDVLGIWGYGKIGRRVAGYGKAFGMQVLVWGRAGSQERAVADGCTVAESREAFFEQADVLSLHLRLDDATRGIVTGDDLARMKPTALLVNTSRAELIEAGAVERALQAGRPGLWALDVFEQEPLPATSPLLHNDALIATPHLGYVEQKSYELYFASAFRNLLDFFAARR
ncbi:D-2-hydroxyacid dehydrogenase family protein [Luteimonas fraxinea]|uniref:D-2-hydroxyacid dehydrogenase family protein n=1 Tax=Luteimonas fraxinea TaxID=2901869 RepID=A0ABS8UDE0_9GAMM|nr:D-2-hydroxyacid dehydrogenase family protein [Luteimonas fraxinea]MCD9096761.1 D-2-hydroxyacid dehydrogenase family protein [Luteimonas fraxinea]MCD9126130.1 D-2-hydroxyacid dehydrogenase family protein [Luteimonas fraxinea]UHH09890.1 D-2-hydroxyacid dehydrogenase family protein [Luteimonas fraxinea]